MRIPTSVIVMSLLTAAPFGLAIRDTLNKKPGLEDELLGMGDYSAREARADREALEAYEREQAAEEQERAEKRKRNMKRLDTLFGKDKASLGSYFDGFAFGMPLDEGLDSKVVSMQSDDFMNPLVDGGSAVDSISVLVYGDDGYDTTVGTCETLRDKLMTAWGPAVNGTWLNSETRIRAVLAEELSCKLSFAKVLDAKQWVAALPLDIIGKNLEKATTNLAGAELFEDSFEWTFPGTGYGVGVSTLYAYADNNKVYSYRVSADTDFDTLVQIRDALSAKLKSEPARDQDSGAWVWKKKPGVTLYQDPGSNNFTLVVGKEL